MLIASECPTNTGTRTQVAVTLIDLIDDLLRLRDHLPLFFGGAVFHEHIDMWDHVKRDLLGEVFGGLCPSDCRSILV